MSDICTACQEPLLVEVEPYSDGEDSKIAAVIESFPDDVELRCGCHFHWECFLDAYSITQYPQCSKDISTLSESGQQQVLCTIRNEGGVQTDFDILPPATEEAYLRAYPEERRGHALLEFCREGDLDAVVNLIKDDSMSDAEVQEEGENDVLRYQGTFEGIEGSALHVAIRYQRTEIAWLMLAVASNLDWSKFPPVVLQAMESLGLSKSDRRGGPDIRTLADEKGRRPADLASEIGGQWTAWVTDGRFAP